MIEVELDLKIFIIMELLKGKKIKFHDEDNKFSITISLSTYEEDKNEEIPKTDIL